MVFVSECACGFLHVQRNGINQIHNMSLPQQPARVRPRATAQIEDARRRRNHVSPDNLLGPHAFEHARTRERALGFPCVRS